MVIPRENKLVRLYIQLTEIKPDARAYHHCCAKDHRAV
jgi:hypothetical protein